MRRSLLIFAAAAAPAAAFMPAAPVSVHAAVQRSAAPLMMAERPASRREALGTAAAFAAGLLLPLRAPANAADAPSGPFFLPPLPYDYKALEPAIDEATMKFHHDKHFNACMCKHPNFFSMPVCALMLLSTAPSCPRV